MNIIARHISVCLLLINLCANANEVATPDLIPPPCVQKGAATPVCGFNGPEDLELLPNGKKLLVSQMHASEKGDTNSKPFLIMDLVNNATRAMELRFQFKAGWGEATCTQPPSAMNPHGIHLSAREDGSLQLLVVNHKDRESIEMLELFAENDGYLAVWHGCVVSHSGGMFNDVAATKEGGFVATVMLDPGNGTVGEAMSRALKGEDSGYLMEWTPAKELVRLPNSEAPFNNGVQLSDDGRFVIYAAWTVRQLRKYDRTTQKVVMTQDLSFYPDNISLRADGHMVVAGLDKLDNFMSCVLGVRAAEGFRIFNIAANPDPRRIF